MMKRKYVKGFLCRDAAVSSDDDYWFYEDEPYWNKIMRWWFDSHLYSRSRVWSIKKFKEEYDCNFGLPGKGEKVECWIELGDE